MQQYNKAHIEIYALCPSVILPHYLNSESPSAPLNVLLSVTYNSISVTWREPADLGGRTDTYYHVSRSDPNRPGSYDGVYISGGTRSHTFHDLKPFQEYCVRVIAHNGVSDQDPDGVHLRTVEECNTTKEGGKQFFLWL